MSNKAVYVIAGAIVVGAIFVSSSLGYVGYKLSSLTDFEIQLPANGSMGNLDILPVANGFAKKSDVIKVELTGKSSKPVYIDSKYPGFQLYGEICTH